MSGVLGESHSPNTGDNSMGWFWIIMMLGTLGVTGFCAKKMYKKKEN